MVPVRGNDAPSATPNFARSEAFPYSRSAAKAHQAGKTRAGDTRQTDFSKTPRTLVGRVQLVSLKDGIPAQRIPLPLPLPAAPPSAPGCLERAAWEGVPLPQADTLRALCLIRGAPLRRPCQPMFLKN